jgi:hypothetical protein
MPDDISQARDRVHLKAEAFAEAMVYSLSNNYLTVPQKALVEGIYQTPIGVFNYVFLGYLAIVEPFGYLNAFKLAAICNIVVAIPVWFTANTAIAKIRLPFRRNSRNCYQSPLIGFPGL